MLPCYEPDNGDFYEPIVNFIVCGSLLLVRIVKVKGEHMKYYFKSVWVLGCVLTALLMMNASVLAQDWNDVSESHGFGGQGWNAGYWNGSNLVPDDYTKNGIAWGSMGTRNAGIGLGLGYGGGGLGIKLPGHGPIRLGW
jgi:hypothetical protein